MAKRKTRQQKATTKEKRRIKQQIKRGQARGLYWSEDFITSIEEMSLKELKSLNRYVVLREARAISQVTGKEISGRQAETEYRSLRMKKSYRERRKLQEYKRYYEQQFYDSDEYDYWNGDSDYPYSPNPISVGETIFNQLMDMIDESWGSKGGSILRGLLDNEISQYGRDKVLKNIGNTPEEMLSSAQAVIYYEDDAENGHRAYNQITNIIRGAFPTEEEAKATGEQMDRI